MAKHRPSRRRLPSDVVAITPRWLATHPLPRPDASGDKDARGTVLVVGGALEVPGAVVLAGIGALRAGAGKLQMATWRRSFGAR